MTSYILIRLEYLFKGAVGFFALYSMLNSYNDNDIKPKIIEEAVVKSIYDGDTITVTVTKEYNVRMLDCWAPEITGEEKGSGLESKKYLSSLIKPGDSIMLEIPTTNRFKDSVSFGRILAYIWKDVDGDGVSENLSKMMVSRGFAKENE